MLMIFAITFYVLSTILQITRLNQLFVVPKFLIQILASFAICLHGWLLYRWIDVDNVQNLAFVNLFSLVCWLVADICLMMSFKKLLESFIVLIFPLAALSICLVWWLPGQYMVNTHDDMEQLVHILLSTFMVSVYCIVMLQALLLTFQEYVLRHHKPLTTFKILPPIETMETWLFQMLSLGFILLTLLLVSSFMFTPQSSATFILQKTFLSMLAWLTFAFLLLGRTLLGWRGRKAIHLTLFGFCLIIIAYFGSKYLLQFFG